MREKHHIQLAAFLEGEARTEVLQGREYRVVPAVLVKSQVLHNNLGASYLPPEAFNDEWAEAANGAPVVIGEHPTKLGEPVTARSPEILNGRGAGSLFRTRAEGEALKAEVFLATDRTSAVPELVDVLDKLDRGERVELSTGFPVWIEEKEGAVNGEAFDFVIHPAGFDHLAVFGGDELGACSVEDGCGLGVNKEEADPATEAEEEIDVEISENKGVMGRTVQALAKAARTLGFLPGDGDALNESDEDRRRLIQDAIRSEFGGLGKEVWVDSVFSEESIAVFEVWSGGDAGLWQVSYQLDEEAGAITLGEPEKVRRVTTFEPVTNAGSVTPEEEESAMKRQELIAHLSKARPCMAERLDGMTDEELTVLHEFQEAGQPVVEETPEDEVVVADPAVVAVVDDGGEMAEIKSVVAEMAKGFKAVQETVATLAEVTKPAVAEQARERDALVAELTANERVPFKEEDLKAKPMDELLMLQSMARPVSYAGRGGPVEAANAEDPDFMSPPEPHWNVAEAKEA